MWRFILVSFAFMGWSFYELSGGNAYQPSDGSRQAVALLQAQQIKTAKIAPAKPKPAPVETTAAITLASAPAEPVLNVKPGRLTKNFVSARVNTPAQVEPTVEPAKVATLLNPESIVPAVTATRTDIRSIIGTRVNMRARPSTSSDIAAKLTGGTAIEVLRDPGDGWLQIRVVETAQVGWMADFLVTASAD